MGQVLLLEDYVGKTTGLDLEQVQTTLCLFPSNVNVSFTKLVVLSLDC